MTKRTFDRAGIQLAVWESGDGVPVIFQHGLGGDAGQPAEVFPEGRGWRCLTLECRGHGASATGPLEDLTLATFSEDLAAFIESEGCAPLAVGGISMGAAIVLRLAVRRPELVRGIIVARPAWLDSRAPANMAPYVLAGDLMSRFPADEARARFAASDTARALERAAPDNLASLLGFFSRRPPEITSELLRRIAAGGPDITVAEIGSIAAPALVIGTARDFVHPLALAVRLAQVIPGAAFVEVESKSKDRNRYRLEFRAALARFLESLEGDR